MSNWQHIKTPRQNIITLNNSLLFFIIAFVSCWYLLCYSPEQQSFKTGRIYMRTRFLAVKALFIASLAVVLQTGVSYASEQKKEDVYAHRSPTLIIDNIICQGNTSTECSFVTKKYYQQIGDVLDTDEISDAKLRLGTLIQFKSVNIHLEKGTQRGHVVVVFNINEASNIQYDLGLSYAWNEFAYNNSISTTSTSSLPALNGKITDFNFLGTGKELSFLFSGTRSFLTNELNFENNTSSESYDSNRFSVGLSYYDPHFFNSSYYYLTASVLHSENESSYVQGNDYRGSTNVDASFGRRFGRHSYFSIDVASRFYTSYELRPLLEDSENKTEMIERHDQHTTYAMTYGWNSEDDVLFPTQGSVFSTSIKDLDRLDDKIFNIHASYKENFAITANQIIALGGKAQFFHYDTCSGNNLCSGSIENASLFARYNHIQVIDKINGTYSGWHIGLTIGAGKSSPFHSTSKFASLTAGYTHQTDSMIYRFSLNLTKGETNAHDEY